MANRVEPLVTEVELTYACPKCGHKYQVVYANGERQYGDLPTCVRGCAVPFSVLDAIASWLDERAMDGAGEPVKPSRSDLCGYTESR